MVFSQWPGDELSVNLPDLIGVAFPGYFGQYSVLSEEIWQIGVTYSTRLTPHFRR